MKKTTGILALCSLLVAAQGQAAVSADQAQSLRDELTPMGAERSANAAGTIPAWTGGMTQTPAGDKFGDVPAAPFIRTN